MIRIGVTHGLRGHYTVMFDDTDYDPIQTGIGSYGTVEEAVREAEDWAMAEGVGLEESTGHVSVDLNVRMRRWSQTRKT